MATKDFPVRAERVGTIRISSPNVPVKVKISEEDNDGNSLLVKIEIEETNEVKHEVKHVEDILSITESSELSITESSEIIGNGNVFQIGNANVNSNNSPDSPDSKPNPVQINIIIPKGVTSIKKLSGKIKGTRKVPEGILQDRLNIIKEDNSGTL